MTGLGGIDFSSTEGEEEFVYDDDDGDVGYEHSEELTSVITDENPDDYDIEY